MNIAHLRLRLMAVHWGNYTMVTATFVTFFAAAIASHLYQYYRNHKTLTFGEFWRLCFPAHGWKSKSSMIDVFMYFANKLFGGLVGIGDALLTIFIASVIARILTKLLPEYRPIHAGYIALVLWSIVCFLAVDFSNFYTHYLQHKHAFLWELHKVHHSATFLSPLTTARMHPLGNKIDSIGACLLLGIPAGIAMFVHGLSMGQILVLNASANTIGTILVLDTLRHSQFPVSFGRLDRILMSPHMHHLHHSVRYEHWDRNMGNKLSIWDWMFGTAIIPQKDEPLTFGIGRGIEVDQQFESLYGVYIRPVIDMISILAGRRPAPEPPQGAIASGTAAASVPPAASPAKSPASLVAPAAPDSQDSEPEGFFSPV
jgi:sterol desaturase/sphingolipid hydroxylase (fatty acid hydroxylase superfamily)